MASFRKRGNSWYYIVHGGLDPKTGKYIQIHKGGFKTKKAAQLAAADVQTALDAHTYVPKNPVTFRDFSLEWLDGYALNVKKSSVRIRKHQLSLMCEVIGQLPVQSITPRIYQEALDTLTRGNFAVNTISGVHTATRMVLKRAMEFQIIRDDPSRFAKPPRRQSRSIQQIEKVPLYLEKGQLQQFLSAAYKDGLAGDYAFFMLLAYTGMRVGEILALTWQDIDFEDNTVSISKTLYTPDNRAEHYELLPPKTIAGYRVIDIPTEVITALRSWRKEYALEKMRWADVWHSDYDFIFTATYRHGYPRTQKAIQSRINRLLRDSPIPVNLTPHVFRHTHISLLAAAGVPLHEIMDRVGQADDETTKKVYLHVTQNRKKEACRLFSDYMKLIESK